MRLRFNVLLFILALAFCGFVTLEEKIGVKYAKDFEMLVTNLEELHPMLYKNFPKEEFDAQRHALSERLVNTESQNMAIYMIQEFIYKIGNGHASNISVYNGDLGVTKALPFSVYILEGTLYINDYLADESFNGAMIYEIENSSSKNIIDSLNIFFPNDGKRDVICDFLQPYFNVFYGAFCGQKDSFLVSTDRGTFKASACKKGSELFDLLVLQKNWKEYFGESNFCAEITPTYGYYRIAKFNNPDQEDAYYSMIKELNAKGIRNLIIDLRYCNGGEAIMAGEMATFLKSKPFTIFSNMYTTTISRPTYLKRMDNKSYFRFRNLRSIEENGLRRVVRLEKCLDESKPKANSFKGHIYIMTSSITLSASTMFCKYLQSEPNVTFVGTETSGAINYFWASNFCVTKCQYINTTFSFGMELLELKENSCKCESQIGLVPINKVEYSIQDRMSKKDKEMEWIKTAIALRTE